MQMKENMLNRIVTGTNHGCISTNLSKRASMQWKHPSSLSTKQSKVTLSAGKVMFTMFWDYQGALLAHFQKHGENMNPASYCEVLLKLRDAVHRKLPGQLARGLLLHHDNAWPHTARITQERIKELQCELLEQPPYKPDVGPSDFHLFGPLKTT
jgi:histone-lysine N-methyltransferase SETMAR